MVLPKEVMLHVSQMLDEKTLLHLSEVNRYLHDGVVTSELFEKDVCVHCTAPFDLLDNRNREACLPIRNKPHRRHKGTRRASPRELRNMKELVKQRLRISRGHRFSLDDSAKETCDSCRRQYLGYQVSDHAWRSRVPSRQWGLCLCVSCYLGAGSNSGTRLRMLVALLIMCVAVFFHYYRCTFHEPSSSQGEDSNCYSFVVPF